MNALEAGACGYVLESVADQDFLTACRAAVHGAAPVHPDALTALVQEHVQRAARGDRLPDRVLTSSETEVVELIAEGCSSTEITALLSISTETVDRHRTTVLQDLELRSHAQLIRNAIRTGLIES